MCIAAGHFVNVYLDNLPGWVRKAANSYYFCTSTFFLLSGFTLAYVYFDGRRGIRIPDGRFWVARLSKIYPLHLAFILLLTPAFLKYGQQAAIAQGLQPGVLLIPAMYLLQVFALDAWNPFIVSVNLPAWSVSALCFFYLVFPAFCRRIRNLPLPRLSTWASLLWALYLVYPVVYTLLDWDKGPHAAMHYGLLHHNPLLRLPEFLIGVLMGRIFMLQREENTTGFHNLVPPAVAVVFGGMGRAASVCAPCPIAQRSVSARPSVADSGFGGWQRHGDAVFVKAQRGQAGQCQPDHFHRPLFHVGLVGTHGSGVSVYTWRTGARVAGCNRIHGWPASVERAETRSVVRVIFGGAGGNGAGEPAGAAVFRGSVQPMAAPEV